MTRSRGPDANSGKLVCEDGGAETDVPDSADAASVPVEPRISYVIARLERAVRAQINERLRPHGLTTLQYDPERPRLARTAAVQCAAGSAAYMTPQAMIEVLNALERKGLIRRDPHPNHRRVYPASLTDEGRRVSTCATSSVQEMEEEMLAGLDPGQRESSASGSRDAFAHSMRACRPRGTARRRNRTGSLEYNQVT
jgi:DNA-binding MarR family transcriptional regulator